MTNDKEFLCSVGDTLEELGIERSSAMMGRLLAVAAAIPKDACNMLMGGGSGGQTENYVPIEVESSKLIDDERFKLIDEDNGIFKYISEEDFEGKIDIGDQDDET